MNNLSIIRETLLNANQLHIERDLRQGILHLSLAPHFPFACAVLSGATLVERIQVLAMFLSFARSSFVLFAERDVAQSGNVCS